MSIFVGRPSFLSCILGCHGNHDISYYQNALILEDNIILHLSGLIEQIDIQKKMS